MSSPNTTHLWAASELIIDFLKNAVKMLSPFSCLKWPFDLFIKIEFHPQFWVS